MQYPLISQYVEAIREAGDNLSQLAHLEPVLDDYGEPFRSSGAFAVVFKMKDSQTGKCYALKCFTEDQEGREEAYRKIADELESVVTSSYITPVRYLERELFVDCGCSEQEFPVLQMDWIEGDTLGAYVSSHYQDQHAMGILSYRFCQLASWLRSQPFAHGDLKPDNIMVREDGTLALVDYDGMYVPAMKGEKSPTIGTRDFSHPQRTADDFDETIDDFALSSIALSLKAISLSPSLYDDYASSDRLLFSADDYCDLSKSQVLTALQPFLTDSDLNSLLSLFLLSHAKKNLSLCSFRLFGVKKPEIKMRVLSTKVTDDDLADAVVDEYGAKYSRDGKKLLSVPTVITSYIIKDGTEVICDRTFWEHGKMDSIVIPSSISSIGYGAFFGCRSLTAIVIPSSVTSIGDFVFNGCSNLTIISIPYSVHTMNGNPFVGWSGKLEINSPYFIYKDGILIDRAKGTLVAFHSDASCCVIPSCVTCIGKSAFSDCKNLTSITIPSSVTSVGDRAFYLCDGLTSVEISSSVTSIGDCAFGNCLNLTSLSLPSSVTSIGDSAFGNCQNLVSLSIPSSVTSIGDGTFCSCRHLNFIEIPHSVTYIGNSAFEDCWNLTSISIPSSVSGIGNNAFGGGSSLTAVEIPTSVTQIGRHAFYGCKKLKASIKKDLRARFGDELFD